MRNYDLLTVALARIRSQEERVKHSPAGSSGLGWESAYDVVHALRGEVLDEMRQQEREDKAAMAIDPEPPGVTLRKMTPEEQAALDLAPVNYGIPVTKDEAKWIASALKSNIRYLRNHTDEPLNNLVSMEKLRERFTQLSD